MSVCVCVSVCVCEHIYRIALNFRGSKFSRRAGFEEFVEIILQIHCMCTLHAVCQKFSLKYFHKRLKIREICEIKDPQKFSTIRYLLTPLYTGAKGPPS